MRNKVDSIQTVLDSLILRPFIDNMDFDLKLGDTYEGTILAVVPNGVSLKSFYIDNKKMDLNQKSFEVVNTFFGPRLVFKPDSVGEFECKVNLIFKSWGNREVPVSWPMTVSE